MSHVVQVDQSGKIGDTQGPTVLAFANDESYAVFIPASVKRDYVRELRRRGKSGATLYLELFAIGLYLLLKDKAHSFSRITIDIEYPGHDATIKEHLLARFQRDGLTLDPDRVGFGLIHRGIRKPKAHDKAYYTYQGKLPPDKVIGLKELVREAK